MGVRWYEWKKLMYHSGGLLIVATFVLLEVFRLIISYGSGLSEDRRYRTSYEQYLSCVVGKVDGETARFFSERNEEFSRAESLLQTIYQRYSLGELTEEEYRFQLGELEQLMAGQRGYDVLYKQYLYARENQENRYLLDTNAWEALISDESLDIGLLLAIMIFALLCFGRESSAEMDIVIRMSANGERKTAGEKILLVTMLSLGSCMLAFCIRVLFFQWGYGFTHGDYPVQSLEFYYGYEGSMSLMETTLRIFLFRMAGCALWGLTVSAAIVGLRKYAVSMLATLALVLLPYYGLPRQYMKYFLPGPLGFFIGTGYYQGTVSTYNEITGQEVYQFIQVPAHIKAILVVVNFLLGMLMADFILRGYTNHWRKKTGGYKAGGLIGVAFCMVCLGGCSGRAASQEASEVLYNLDNRYYYESSDYLVYVDYVAGGGSYIAVREKESGNIFPLVRDVFRGNKEVSSCFYGEGNNIYYMERSFDNKNRYFSKLYDTISIICVDLDTFESHTIFQDNANQERTSALGLSRIGQDTQFYSDIVAFVVKEDMIYFISSDKVSAVNALSGGRKTLFSYNSGNVAYDGHHFFFLDDMSRLLMFSLKEEQEETVCDIVAGKFLLEGDGVLYTDREHGAALTAFCFSTQNKEILVREEPLVFYSDGDNLFFVPKRESVIYKLEAEGGRPKEIGMKKSAVIYPFSSYGSIFVPDMETGGMAEYQK